MRLMRKCPCAVWLVTPSRVQFQHVLGCVDTATDDPRDVETNDKVLELSRNISHYHGGYYSIVHAWSVWNEPMLKHRMDPDSFAEMVQSSQHQVETQLEKFLAKHGSGLNDKNVHLIKGNTAAAISSFVDHQDVDLVVMGTVGRSGVSGMVMGNTAEQILNQLTCSVLALKPSDFVCPIQMEN
ncbi:MAG: universal stress protein [Pirellulaceae bacterium]|nr:universal stress protein [Pirellulaceae bacterium]